MRRHHRTKDVLPVDGVVVRKFSHSNKSIDAYSEAILAYKEIGKVRVDCKFRLSDSLFGTLGHNAKPAGIVYMDLSFDQPSDCRLAKATVVITLERDKEGKHDGRQIRPMSAGLRITNLFGPIEICGPSKSMLSQDKYHFTPHVEAFGFGGGGLGVDKETTKLHTSKWAFNGHISPAKDKQTGMMDEYCSILRWELAENDLESQATHGKVFQTAFAFEHEGPPFNMRVEIDGKLEKTSDQMRKFFKFGGVGGRKNASTTTRINLEGKRGQKLDHFARQLPEQLYRANRLKHPLTASEKTSTLLDESEDLAQPEPDDLIRLLVDACNTATARLPSDAGTTLVGTPESSRSVAADAPKSDDDLNDVGKLEDDLQVANGTAESPVKLAAQFPPFLMLARLLASLMDFWGF
jgi:hypothetical protein